MRALCWRGVGLVVAWLLFVGIVVILLAVLGK